MVFYYPLRLQHYSLSLAPGRNGFPSVIMIGSATEICLEISVTVVPYHARSSSRYDKRRHFYFVSDYYGSTALLLGFKWSVYILNCLYDVAQFLQIHLNTRN